MSGEPTDFLQIERLLSRARLGDRPAISQLFDCFRGLVVGVCAAVLGRSDLLADAVQEVFIKLLRSVGSIRHPKALGPWLRKVARTTALDLARNQSGRPAGAEKNELAARSEQANTAPSPLDELIEDETSRRTLAAMMALRPDYREVLLLRYLHSRSYAEMADVLGEPVTAIQVRLHRARKELLKSLGERP